MEKKNKDLLKLSKLLIHWAEHNDSHKDSFTKWQEVARENGLDDVVLNLEQAKKMLDESSRYLLKAHKELDY